MKFLGILKNNLKLGLFTLLLSGLTFSISAAEYTGRLSMHWNDKHHCTKHAQMFVDEVFETVNDRNKLIKILAMAKSAIRHNMADDLPKMKLPTCIIWGKNDNVTPPEVADEFHKIVHNSDLFWIDKCGHAPMMEQPDQFNALLIDWLSSKIVLK